MAAARGFSRGARLLKRAEFVAVMKNGGSSRDSYFSVFGLKSLRAEGRLGITVSRRAAAKAVARNRIKRFIRESFRHHRKRFVGVDVVVIARSAAAQADAQRLRAALRAHWDRIEQICALS